MHKITRRYQLRNEILKSQGLIVDHTITEEAINFRVDEQGLNYDLIITSSIVPVTPVQNIEIKFNLTKGGFETE